MSRSISCAHALLLVAAATQAQLPWVRTVALERVYHRQWIDKKERTEHEFLLFYANDSVVSVWMSDYEGGWSFDDRKSPKRLLKEFVERYHCEPSDDEGVTVCFFNGSGIEYRSKWVTEITFCDGDACLTMAGNQYRLLQKWGRVVHPKRKFPRWVSGCAGEEID